MSDKKNEVIGDHGLIHYRFGRPKFFHIEAICGKVML